MLFFKKLVFLIKFFPIDLILFLRGIKIEVAEDAESLEKIFRLRKNVYEEKQYAVFDKNCVSWQDDYDNHAVNIGAFRSGEALGAVRMIYPFRFAFSD
ncbi:MAG: hypothetical protein Q7R53_01585 [bacterium]|nr:hypothetical protein [bacterium]